MSDPAKTPEEIEDVLASIRRLVSDHTPGPDGSMQRAETDEIAVPDEPAPVPASDDRLVLTPSFRVTEPDDPWLTVAESDTDADDDDVTESLILDVLAQDDTAGDGSESQAADGDWQPDDRLAQYDTVGADDAADLSQGGDAPTDVDRTEPDMPSSVDEGMMDEEGATDAEDIADLIRLDGSTPELADFESETGDENWPNEGAEAALLTLVARRDHGTPDSEAEEAQTDDPDLDGGTGTDDAEISAMVPDDTPEPEPQDEETPEPEVEALEAEIVEPDEADEGELLDTIDESEDSSHEPASAPIFARQTPQIDEEEPEATEAIEAEDLGEEPSPFTFPDADEGVLDEETLREIIVEVVREELQGVLGQRITRNVRKMVRREIRLALAAEDLD